MFSKKRDLGTVAWEDPLAWTESMKGPKWQALIHKETKQFHTVLEKYIHPYTLQVVQDELYLASEAERSHPYLVEDKVFVWLSSMTSLEWKWNTPTATEYSANDIAVDSAGNVWQVMDTGNGAETYTLTYHKFNQEKPTWALHTHVGPYVVVINSLCFFLEVKDKLWYYRLSCVNAYTGRDYKVLYEEKDPQWNLSLQKAENHTAYLVRENSGLQEAFFFFNESLKKLPQEGFFVLAGGAPNDYFVTQGRGTDDWVGRGPRLSRWKLPPANKGIPHAVWVHHTLLITRKEGMYSLWKCSTQEAPVLLDSGMKKFKFNSFGIHHQDSTATLTCMIPGEFSSNLSISKGTIQRYPPAMPAYGNATHHLSATHVPYFLITPCKGKAKALLVVGYGAYGLPTPISTARWYPLILRGWAIAIAMVRGGGDDTMAWANAARTWKREASIEDFESVIRSAQKHLKISSSQTAIYGRSAGGILVGAAAARQTHTRLFKALYAEVPYLDLLRTTTNPTLPLTQLEYDEFGNPAHRIEDLVTLGKVSPLNQIPEKGFPQLFALMRTGQNDSQVYAYEPVKWILRARGHTASDTTKLLAFEPKEGHFVNGHSGLRNRAIDICFLLAWNNGSSFRI
jgi:hypothetical protein